MSNSSQRPELRGRFFASYRVRGPPLHSHGHESMIDEPRSPGPCGKYAAAQTNQPPASYAGQKCVYQKSTSRNALSSSKKKRIRNHVLHKCVHVLYFYAQLFSTMYL